jgi:hypothetical protein
MLSNTFSVLWISNGTFWHAHLNTTWSYRPGSQWHCVPFTTSYEDTMLTYLILLLSMGMILQRMIAQDQTHFQKDQQILLSSELRWRLHTEIYLDGWWCATVGAMHVCMCYLTKLWRPLRVIVCGPLPWDPWSMHPPKKNDQCQPWHHSLLFYLVPFFWLTICFFSIVAISFGLTYKHLNSQCTVAQKSVSMFVDFHVIASLWVRVQESD